MSSEVFIGNGGGWWINVDVLRELGMDDNPRFLSEANALRFIQSRRERNSEVHQDGKFWWINAGVQKSLGIKTEVDLPFSSEAEAKKYIRSQRALNAKTETETVTDPVTTKRIAVIAIYETRGTIRVTQRRFFRVWPPETTAAAIVLSARAKEERGEHDEGVFLISLMIDFEDE